MITLTEKAISKLEQIADDENLTTNFVRVGVRGGGCSGFQFDMFFEETIKETDHTFDFNNIIIVVDPVSLQFLEGTEVDYIDSLMSSGFKFNNPNITGSCGCGKSVSF